MAADNQHDVTLRFTRADGTVELPAVLVETSTSPHTSRELRQLRTEITCAPEEAVAIRELVDDSPLIDEQGVEWAGRLATQSYIEGGPHNLVIEWAEHEQLMAELVEFEGFSLRPSDYHEDERDGVVAVTFRTTLSEDEMKALWALREARKDPKRRYWPVVRRGVSDEPRMMRLGRVLWHQQGDRYEHRVTLVDESEDSQEPGLWAGMRAEPELSHLMAGVAELAGQFNALLDALQKGNVIDTATIEQVQNAGRRARTQREYTFYEVDDLSRWQ